MTAPSDRSTRMASQLRQWRRGLLSAHALNGASVALGMALIATLVYSSFGIVAATNASVGAIIVLLCDGVRARRGKFAHLIAAPLLGVPLFFVVQLLRGHPIELGLVLLPATFIAFLFTAWGRRGMPVTAAVMFAMLLALAPPPASNLQEAVLRSAWCATGSALYVLYGVASNAVLNRRYRTQVMADLLFTVAALLRVHVGRIRHELGPDADGYDAQALSEVLRRQAALADQLQEARDLILESPRTPYRKRLAGMLVVVLEMRDRLIASELDIERVSAQHADAVQGFVGIMCAMALDVERVADALLLGRKPAPATDYADELQTVRHQAQAAARGAAPDAQVRAQAALIRSVSIRVGDQNAAVQQLVGLARDEREPDLSAVRSGWHLFVSPAYWSWQPLLRLWHWRQPALRHALRAALAVGVGYVVALVLPWASRDYWILLTIVVVLRGSLAQTLERRDERVLGTLLGSVLAAVLLALQPPLVALVLTVVVAQGVAHAFAARRYMVTAVAASILGLVLAQLLNSDANPTFAFIERIGDTLLGAGIAWGFSYVLPMWEREQLAERVQRVCRALSRHARHSLALAALDDITGQPELAWRLARREAYDALSALVQTTSRALAEPRAVRPPVVLLEQLQGHGYQLLGQLSAIQSIVLLRRDRLQIDQIAEPVALAARTIEQTLDLDLAPRALALADGPDATAGRLLRAIPEDLPDPHVTDASPWLLRRLSLVVKLAEALRADAQRVLEALSEPVTEPRRTPDPQTQDRTQS